HGTVARRPYVRIPCVRSAPALDAIHHDLIGGQAAILVPVVFRPIVYRVETYCDDDSRGGRTAEPIGVRVRAGRGTRGGASRAGCGRRGRRGGRRCSDRLRVRQRRLQVREDRGNRHGKSAATSVLTFAISACNVAIVPLAVASSVVSVAFAAVSVAICCAGDGPTFAATASGVAYASSCAF